MATSTNLKVAQTGDDRNTSKKIAVKVIKKGVISSIIRLHRRRHCYMADCCGAPRGRFPKKGGAEMAVGVRQVLRGRLGAPPVLR